MYLSHSLFCSKRSPIKFYTFLNNEDEYLGYKPGVVEQAKFKYSPLGKVFNKWLEKADKKEGLLKRLKNVEDKDKEQFKTIKDQIEKRKTIINARQQNR